MDLELLRVHGVCLLELVSARVLQRMELLLGLVRPLLTGLAGGGGSLEGGR